MKWFQMALALLCVSLFSLATVGCNTFRGMGQDIQSGGETVEQAADEAQHELRR